MAMATKPPLTGPLQHLYCPSVAPLSAVERTRSSRPTAPSARSLSTLPTMRRTTSSGSSSPHSRWDIGNALLGQGLPVESLELALEGSAKGLTGVCVSWGQWCWVSAFAMRALSDTSLMSRPKNVALTCKRFFSPYFLSKFIHTHHTGPQRKMRSTPLQASTGGTFLLCPFLRPNSFGCYQSCLCLLRFDTCAPPL